MSLVNMVAKEPSNALRPTTKEIPALSNLTAKEIQLKYNMS